MNTDSLIRFLACGAGPVQHAMATKRIIFAVATGVLTASLLALATIGLVSPATFATSAPWVKLAYTAGLLTVATLLTKRLSLPGFQVGRLPLWVLLVIAVMSAAALFDVSKEPSHTYLEVLFSETWLVCPWMVLTYSLPAMIALFWATRGLAPTQLRLAGTAAGLTAGAAGAMGYSFVCPESSMLFVAVWYTAGIALSAGVGTILGPWVMRW